MCVLIINEIFMLQNFVFIVLFIYSKTVNIFTTWYLSGLYLLVYGIYLLIEKNDIFIGFLWIIDFGVGLIFFIFILHFSSFLYQKSTFNVFSKIKNSLFMYWIILLMCFFLSKEAISFANKIFFNKLWYFLISWYDYYNVFFSHANSNLQLLREIYFYNNSFEFFVINFMLLYGIFSSIVLSFLIKKLFNMPLYSQFQNKHLLRLADSNVFIRQQNFSAQQYCSTGTRVWKKKKKN